VTTQEKVNRLPGIFLLIIILSIASWAETKMQKVDNLFAKWDSTVSPGAALAIIQEGEIIYRRGYGMANLEHNVPITSKTVFRIGSTSKQFTAAAVALLSLQGKISLDDDIRKFVPELPHYEKTITVRNLIHHTSGIRDYLGLAYLSGKSDDDFYSPEETVAMIARQTELNFVPGDEHLYSNSGYFLLGVIVKRVSGKSLNEFAQEHIFKPLGMHNTHFHDDYSQIVKNRADGHVRSKGGFKISNTTLNHVGDGGVFTTVEDLYLWDQAFYSFKLGKELIDLIHQTGVLNNKKKLDYAFGLGVGDYKGLKLVSHGGGFVGFRAEMIRFPEEKFSVICLANLGSISPSRLCRQVADIFLADKFTEGKSPEKKVKPTEAASKKQEITAIAPLAPEKLKTYAGAYYNEELPASYMLVFEKEKLFFKHRNAPKTSLKLIGEDKFRSGYGKMEFIRGKDKKITGFFLDAGRVRIQFKKK
jgi:CubicO group peptidase (beta-lactamase class C family)